MSCTFTVYHQRLFPNDLKLAKVLPIYKSDDKRQLKNHRPITVLPLIKNILKKIVADSVIDFFGDHYILYNKQIGTRMRHSTTHAIFALTEIVSMALDSGKIVGGVFHYHGIRGSLMQWFQSYLSIRSQYVFFITVLNQASET